MSAKFDKDNLHRLLKIFNNETEGTVSKASFPVRRQKELLGKLLPNLIKLPQNQAECKAIYGIINTEYAKFIYDLTVLQTKCPDAPTWCGTLVSVLKCVLQHSELNNKIQRQTIENFNKKQKLKFLIYAKTFLKTTDKTAKPNEPSD